MDNKCRRDCMSAVTGFLKERKGTLTMSSYFYHVIQPMTSPTPIRFNKRVDVILQRRGLLEASIAQFSFCNCTDSASALAPCMATTCII
jgi:hypothetical protein